MSIFGNIMGKIFHHPAAAAEISPTPDADTATTGAAPASGATVDVGAVLTAMAAAKGGGGNYETSIVDLLKLLDLDSSLDSRKELGTELGVHAGADGSADQNIALHKAVVHKLAENGGKLPESMKG